MTAETSMPALRVEGLTKTFGTKTVLRDVDLKVRKGETVVVIGASGSGKTTLLRCINHLEAPSAGVVDVDGQPVGRVAIPGGWKDASVTDLDIEDAKIVTLARAARANHPVL